VLCIRAHPLSREFPIIELVEVEPYAELMLRWIKPIEFRTRPTKIMREQFYIYSSNQWTAGKLSDAPFPFRALSLTVESAFIPLHSGGWTFLHMASRHRAALSARLLSLRSVET
jgi:hypothetical protein